MAMTLYRVQKAKRWNGQPQPGFAGVGRWHSGGRAVLYLAETPAVAVLEWIKGKLATGLLETEISEAKLIMVSATLDLDGAVLASVSPDILPSGWEQIPNARSQATQKLGDAWLTSRNSLALRVPTATLPSGMGWNVLLNPAHPDYPVVFPLERLTVTPFGLDYYLGICR